MPTSPPMKSRPSAMRVLLGGFLMGIANLVPGVSGGTMILAVGLYDRFIEAVARLTSLRWRAETLRFLLLLGIGLGLAIVGLATPAVWLVTEHRWIAYSLFVGMTLGGVPLLWRVVRPPRARDWIALGLGFACMLLIAFGLSDSPLPHTFLVLAVVGALAAASMILPGISGSYILLIFGLYDVVVGSLRPRQLLDDLSGALAILVPVAIGVALGIGVLSNVLRVVLARYERPAHAALLGLLLGAVLGLWPFQEAVHPELVTRAGVAAVHLLVEGASLEEIEAQTGIRLDETRAAELAATHAGLATSDLRLLGLDLELYRPSLVRLGLALALGLAGFSATRLMGAKEEGSPAGSGSGSQ